ncbi:hypothetical protein ACIGHG_11145 [Bacillus sp. NPDC077411]|uniref:hypothetical protein n=1 Tax=Bacillus sp. NPDC077411 TaxID=3363947 RepID=UPI0037C9D428
MKVVHLYDEKTGAYIVDEIIFPQYDETTGEEFYDIPKNSTELPLFVPNLKPVFRNGEWIEVATPEEIEEFNKPPVQHVTELKKLQDKVEFLADQLSDIILGL